MTLTQRYEKLEKDYEKELLILIREAAATSESYDKAAQKLGMSRGTFLNRCKEHNITITGKSQHNYGGHPIGI